MTLQDLRWLRFLSQCCYCRCVWFPKPTLQPGKTVGQSDPAVHKRVSIDPNCKYQKILWKQMVWGREFWGVTASTMAPNDSNFLLFTLCHPLYFRIGARLHEWRLANTFMNDCDSILLSCWIRQSKLHNIEVPCTKERRSSVNNPERMNSAVTPLVRLEIDYSTSQEKIQMPGWHNRELWSPIYKVRSREGECNQV